MPWGILWPTVGARVIFLSQAWQTTHTHFLYCVFLHETVSLSPLRLSLSGSVLIGILALSCAFFQVAVSLSQNPFGLSKLAAKCGCLPLWAVTPDILWQCVGADLWPFFSLWMATGHSDLSAKAVGQPSKSIWHLCCVSHSSSPSFGTTKILILFPFTAKALFYFDILYIKRSKQRLNITACVALHVRI